MKTGFPGCRELLEADIVLITRISMEGCSATCQHPLLMLILIPRVLEFQSSTVVTLLSEKGATELTTINREDVLDPRAFLMAAHQILAAAARSAFALQAQCPQSTPSTKGENDGAIGSRRL
jgi:hypothetical protein